MATDAKARALVITGGHGFQEKPFWEIFDSFENFAYDSAAFPDAFKHLSPEGAKNYDALVFYDMWQQIAPDQQESYIKLLHDGKAVVSLHHALGSFQNWDEYKKILGGYWKSGEGTFKPRVKYTVKIADPNHPVTSGIPDFEVEDETYGNFHVNSKSPLLKADHPDSGPIIGWTNQYGNSPIVYLQLGHDGLVYGNPNYRKLIYQAIRWTVDMV